MSRRSGAGRRAARRRRPDRGARRRARRSIARAGLRGADADACRARPTSRATSAATSIPTRSLRRDPRCAPRSARGSGRRCARPIGGCRTTAPTARTPPSAGRRALKNACLDLLAAAGASAIALAARQYHQATNMTDRMAALATLSLHAVPERQAAIDDFYRRYADDPLIIDKWLALQAAIPEAATLDRVRALTAHPAFSLANPNRVRALIGAFAQSEPDPVQPPRRRRLRVPRRNGAGARPEEPAGRRAPRPPRSAPGARSSRCGASAPRPRCGASRRRQICRATSPTSSRARSTPDRSADGSPRDLAGGENPRGIVVFWSRFGNGAVPAALKYFSLR